MCKMFSPLLLGCAMLTAPLMLSAGETAEPADPMPEMPVIAEIDAVLGEIPAPAEEPVLLAGRPGPPRGPHWKGPPPRGPRTSARRSDGPPDRRGPRPSGFPPHTRRHPGQSIHSQVVFALMDQNSDGLLDPREFDLGMQKIKSHMAKLHRRFGAPGTQGPRTPRMGTRGPHRGGPPHDARRAMAAKAAHLARHAFKETDKNQDKKLTADEVPAKRREGFKKLLEKADKNDNDALDPDEARATLGFMLKKIAASDHPALGMGRLIFALSDLNADGKVALDEVPAERRDRFKWMLGKFDEDGDKALSRDEAKRMAMKMVKHRRKPGDCRPWTKKDSAKKDSAAKKADKDCKKPSKKKPAESKKNAAAPTPNSGGSEA